MLSPMKIAFYESSIGGYGAMLAGQYDRLQEETRALVEKRREIDPKIREYKVVSPILVVDTKDFEGHG